MAISSSIAFVLVVSVIALTGALVAFCLLTLTDTVPR